MRLSSVFGLILASLIIVGCGKNMAPQDESLLKDEELIQAIQNSLNKEVIPDSELPSESKDLLNREYLSEITLETMIAPELGYEVFLGGLGEKSGKFSKVYFNLDGRKLNPTSDKKTSAEVKDMGMNREGDDHWTCFELVYPITFVMPDASTIMIDGEAGLIALREWYDVHQDVSAKPEYQYPIELIFDGETKTIQNADEMNRVYKSCGGKRWDKKPCFTLVYPVTFLTSDGTSFAVTKDDESGWVELKAWIEAHPEVESRPELVYPLDILYSDSTIVTIENHEEMLTAKDVCAENDGHGDNDGGHHDEDNAGGGNGGHQDDDDDNDGENEDEDTNP